MCQPRSWLSVRSLACASARSTNTPRGREFKRSECLAQARPAQRFNVVRALGFVDRHLLCHPGQGNVGLHAANLLDHDLGEIVVTRHRCGRSEQAIGADEIRTLADRLTREAHRLIIVAPDKLRISGDAVVDGGEWITWAQMQRMASGVGAFLPAPNV